ncbi:hypothetical protein EDD41_0459 [Luteococcus japonicus]|uniref:SatD family protein n=1 Tax=Luteococcus japonicus TaxID=33984 RepID=A0A3N1ZQY8_9ACTN|nr:hypothetical protein [Luteococcus japonicus]ROR53319.1 hypothetical protein EDD41_0459 [Luteococcus japonicus]
MKDPDFTSVFAVTADQRHSRRSEDRVPEALAALEHGLRGQELLPAERTAGDELQLLLPNPDMVLTVFEQLVRLGDWRIGIGLGGVESPLPRSTRSARGGAYLAARAAIERAHSTPTGLALECQRPGRAGNVGAGPYGDDRRDTQRALHDAESALWLLEGLLKGRSVEGWQIVELLDEGIGVGQAAQRLGISPSAASQRHQRAGWEVGVRGRELCAGLLGSLQEGLGSGTGGAA